MNLYRSFGNLMETWVAERSQGTAASPGESSAYTGPMPACKPAMAISLRSESEDSVLGMASTETSRSWFSPAEHPQTSPSAGAEDRLTPSSHPQSPVPSSSSSSSHSLFATRTEQPTVAGHLEVEQALQRTDLQGQGHTRAPQSSGAMPPRLATVTRRRGQSTGVLGPRRTVNQQVGVPPRRPLSLYHNGLSAQSEACGVAERQALSPGLSYLEQVCRMLEEMARLQMINRGLQNEVEALREQQTKHEIRSCDFLPWDPSVNNDEPPVTQRLEAREVDSVSSQLSVQNSNVRSHFRRRSASDSRAIMGHLRTQPVNSRVQCVSVYGVDNLLEQAEDWDCGEQEFKTDTQNKSNTLRFKLASLKRGSGRLGDSESTRSSGHRLSQLFRRKRKTGAEGVDE